VYTIKPCSKYDLPRVLELSKLWAAEGITLGYENVQHTMESLEKRLNGYFYVAAVGDEVVGYVFGDVRKGMAAPAIPLEEEYLEIFEIYIHPDHRKQGLGKRLVAEVVQQAESRGIDRALVGSSNQRWAETAAFYEQLGFKMWYIQMFK
jgi:GNAT superfamily N-acetyltransferase